MKYIDTHCHIDMILAKEPGLSDYSAIKELFPESFEKLIHICCHPDNIQWSLDFINTHAEAFASFGVHPHDAKDYNDKIHQEILNALNHPKAIALGECGLDYFYEQSPREIQIQVFEKQLRAAQDRSLPLILHTRDAEEDTLQVLKNNLDPQTKVHVHCFTGNADFAEQLLDLSPNIYFGFTGIVTFKNADNVRESLERVPIHRLLLETDSPFLAPVPFRGKTAHPGMIPEIASKIAELKRVETSVIFEQCRQNTKFVYGI